MEKPYTHAFVEKYPEDHLLIKVGKRKWFQLSLVDLISHQQKLSKTQVRQLIKQKAISLYIPILDKEEES